MVRGKSRYAKEKGRKEGRKEEEDEEDDARRPTAHHTTPRYARSRSYIKSHLYFA